MKRNILLILGGLVFFAGAAFNNNPKPDPEVRYTALVSETGETVELTQQEVEFVRWLINPDNAKHWIAEVSPNPKSATPPETGVAWRDYRNGCGLECSKKNRALGWQMLTERGMGYDQWKCLDPLWMQESGWDHLQPNNSGSSAFGIPQALPGSKMGPGWNHDPVVQIAWGLDEYIPSRYGTPCDAYSFKLRNGHY